MTEDEPRFLSCVYSDPALIDTAVAAGLTSGHFTGYQYAAQWDLLCSLRMQGRETDPAAIYAAAVESGSLDKLGGLAGITAASTADGHSILNGPALLSVLLAGHARREAWKLLQRAKEMVEKDSADMSAVSKIAEDVVAVCAGKAISHRSTGDAIKDAAKAAAIKWSGAVNQARTITLGLSKLDRFMTRIENHEYVLLCARPSTGKSSALAAIAHKTVEEGGKVAYFTLETTAKSIVNQIAAQRGQLNLKVMAHWMPEHQRTYTQQIEWLTRHKDRLVIYDEDFSLDSISARSRLLATSFKPDLVIIDYLGLVQTDGKDLYQRVSKVSKQMIPMRKMLGCALIAGQQLNRSSQTQEREPNNSDLRDSGQLEEDAHRIIMLHWINNQQIDTPVREYKWLQTKCRDGPLESVTGIKFRGATTTFCEE